MTQPHQRSPAPENLAILQFDATPRVAFDEISALRLHKPVAADYAAFIRNPASVADMVARARLHGDQVARFVALAQISPPNAVTQNLRQLHALVLLNTTATIAIAIMPARDGADRHARRQQGEAFIQSLESPAENELRNLGEIAFGLKHQDAHIITQDAIAFASRGHGEACRPSRATIHRIEEQATLRHWLQHKTDSAALLAEARQHAVIVDRFARLLNDAELSPENRDEITAVHEGALLQHALTLAELALAPVAIDASRILRAAHVSIAAQPRLQAGTLIAIAVGQHYRAMAAANPC